MCVRACVCVKCITCIVLMSKFVVVGGVFLFCFVF